jgi:hypothetical protein
MNISITEAIRKMMGWCPNASMINKEEEMLMEMYDGEYINRIKRIGFSN